MSNKKKKPSTEAVTDSVPVPSDTESVRTTIPPHSQETPYGGIRDPFRTDAPAQEDGKLPGTSLNLIIALPAEAGNRNIKKRDLMAMAQAQAGAQISKLIDEYLIANTPKSD